MHNHLRRTHLDRLRHSKRSSRCLRPLVQQLPTPTSSRTRPSHLHLIQSLNRRISIISSLRTCRQARPTLCLLLARPPEQAPSRLTAMQLTLTSRRAFRAKVISVRAVKTVHPTVQRSIHADMISRYQTSANSRSRVA